MGYTELHDNVTEIIKDFLKEGNLQVKLKTDFHCNEITVQLCLGESVISENCVILGNNNPYV